MKNILKRVPIIMTFVMMIGTLQHSFGQNNNDTPFRRPISTNSPAWIVHIDTWTWPDPQKCIELIPEDIRPYVIFNISLSVSEFVREKYPFTIAESWLRTCAEMGVWAMIQPASGGPNNFSNTSLEVYEYFYKYPNFVGWNFCEQNWGYDTFQDYLDRLQLFVELMQLADRYGGYLVVSNFLTHPMGVYNGVGKLKSHTAYEEACKTYQDHYVICNKFTSADAFYENESTNLGPFLSGYAGVYGLRFDLCGFEKRTEAGRVFPEASGAIPIVEHFMMTGATVTDGPELTWQIAILSDGTESVSDGFTAKKWRVHPQFSNINIDLFRKTLDGTIRIPDRAEVIEETKVVYVCDEDNTSGSFAPYQSLYTGLYAMDGEKANNTNWFKKTGRYPSIPVVHKEGAYETGAFETIIRSSEYSRNWSNNANRVNAFNDIFPEEYVGDIYARRIKNRWLTYNPDMDHAQAKSGIMPLKFNSCDSMYISHQWYSLGVVTESQDKMEFYLNNYCSSPAYGVREDVIKIYGCSTEPTWSHADRGNHGASVIVPSWDSENKIFSLAVKHNGPLDITVNCVGKNQRDELANAIVNIIQPKSPPIYTGPRQYEAENFEYKNVADLSSTGLKNYTAMGYVNFGKSASAALRKTINVPRSGVYKLETRYSTISTSPDIKTIDLLVNGERVAVPTFTKTTAASDWNVNTQYITLKTGDNQIEFRANAPSASTIYLDNIIISEDAGGDMYHFENDEVSNSAGNIELITVLSGSLGVVSHTGSNAAESNYLKSYGVGSVNDTGVANLDMFASEATDYAVVWKESMQTTEAKRGVLLRGNQQSNYADGLKQGYLFVVENNTDNTITLNSYIVHEDNIEPKTSFTPDYSISNNQNCWFRASVIGDKMIFECTSDSVNWVGESKTVFTDDTYNAGSSQLVWGLGLKHYDWLMDNLRYQSGSMVVSATSLKEFNYEVGKHSEKQTFVVSGNALYDVITISCTDDFEVSINSNTGYASSLMIPNEVGNITPTNIYVRMKDNLSVGRYFGEIMVSSDRIRQHLIPVSGEVYDFPTIKIYDFSEDTPSRRATNPPAIDMTIGVGNSATAAVVSYTDLNGEKSNVLKPFSSGQRNATGVIDLNLFSKKATNYSVTWKQCVTSVSKDYKIGMLLRGDTTQIGDQNSGYVQGIMNGYLFIVFKSGNQNQSQFRIYKSTSTYNNLNMLVDAEVKQLSPAADQPVWYRANVSGWSTVTLTFEYSLDEGITWHAGASAVDNEHVFNAGATQFVWGLAADNNDFYMDDITFYGISNMGDSNTSGIDKPVKESSSYVLYDEYFTLTGQKIANPKATGVEGIFIIRSYMSDGTVQSHKAYVK